MEVSQLKFYSYGIVLKDLVVGEDSIKVMPMEFRLGTRVKIDDEVATEELSHGVAGGEDTVKMTTGKSITARWLKFDSNRVFAPNVMREEQVMIYRLGDTDVYYWQDFNVANVKRLETVVYAFSADPTKKMADDLSNAYMIMVSTHDKHITIQTSKANGEPFAYTVQLNTDEGNFQLTDDIGNTFYLDSAAETIGAVNSAGSSLKIQGQDMFGDVPAGIYLKAGQIVDVNVPFMICNVEDMQITGNVVIDKLLSVTGALSAAADAVITGSLTVASDITTKGALNVASDLIVKGIAAISGKLTHGGPPCC